MVAGAYGGFMGTPAPGEAINMPPTPTLADLIREVGFVAKDKQNEHDGYSYQSEAAIKRAVQEALIKLRIAPEGVHYETLADTWVEARGGGKRNLVKTRCTIKMFGGLYDGEGSGIDYGDKATMKAQTAAYREAWKGMLCIPSGGGDPEEESEHDEPEAPAPRRERAPESDEWAAPPPEPAPRAPRRRTAAQDPTLPKMGWLKQYGGGPVSEAPTTLLQRYIEWRQETPALPKWRERESELLRAIADEISARESGESDQQGPSGTDRIPF